MKLAYLVRTNVAVNLNGKDTSHWKLRGPVWALIVSSRILEGFHCIISRVYRTTGYKKTRGEMI